MRSQPSSTTRPPLRYTSEPSHELVLTCNLCRHEAARTGSVGRISIAHGDPLTAASISAQADRSSEISSASERTCQLYGRLATDTNAVATHPDGPAVDAGPGVRRHRDGV